MYCLRSFAVLLFLPMPWSPPLLNFLFLLTFYLQKRPCVYCTILLIGVYVSTCYWNLAPATAESISSSISLASNTTITNASEAISACWMDFNGGALLRPRMLLRNASTSSCSLSNASYTKTLPLEEATKDLAAVRWLSNGIDKISKGFTEDLLGIKLTL
ncbi:hypothetical protein P389DRAFT_76700 [Cystobasidium minutum MCA 4210]|uniref:uncharacterized protein n=1 Tax=Cystobasidium minutum MCA 4210 TaxID=1397322 RepID=UPI0034CF99D7|eukprot:jgi/Rhomi1/76700/CE76699_898